MEKIKDRWYRLVAKGLVTAHADMVAANDYLAARFSKQLKITAEQDSRLAIQIIRERAGIDPTLPGKMDLLRQHLRQELAVDMYHEELLHLFTDGDYTSFNDLSLEERKKYFERVDEQVSGANVEDTTNLEANERFYDPYDH